MANAFPPAFQHFIDGLRGIWAKETETAVRMESALPLLRDVVNDPQMQEISAGWPSTEGRKNLLFYVDSDYGFAINGVVRVPGRTGSVHDHGNVWVAYGVMTGTESLERYTRLDDGSKSDWAKIELLSVTRGSSGKVDLVPPYDIHAEQGGPTRSTAIILRSERLGDLPQNMFDLETGHVKNGPGATQIPYELRAY